MTPKKVLSKPSPQSTDDTPVASATATARPKRSASVVKKPVAEVPETANANAAKPARKSLGKKATPLATPAAAKTNSRTPTKSSAKSSARSTPRSTARPATLTKTRQPARVKTTAVAPAPDQASDTETLKTVPLLAEQAVDTTGPEKTKLKTMAADAAVTATVKAPVVSDAELWEQDSPIRIRIAQLRTRNSLLEEQLQRLRPPFQVRGKKK